PGESVLTIEASRPPVPEEGKTNTSCRVCSALWRPLMTSFCSAAYSWPRWLIIGSESARSTTSGHGVGPGIINKGLRGIVGFSSLEPLHVILKAMIAEPQATRVPGEAVDEMLQRGEITREALIDLLRT